jgi:hypothetical protein
MDRAWWNEYGAGLKAEAELWTTNREASRIYKINHIEYEVGAGVAKGPNRITLGGNSGYQAVALAVHFGAARIVLLGYDMQLGPEKRKHWHGDHKRLGNPTSRKFPEWVEAFGKLGRDAAPTCTIVNASRQTALQCFERIDLANCLA